LADKHDLSVIDADEVRQIRELSRRKWGAKRIARELGIARNTVRRYLRGGDLGKAESRRADCVLPQS
jgi:IS30 family transposase